jgi:hypothetical protein
LDPHGLINRNEVYFDRTQLLAAIRESRAESNREKKE